MGRWDAKRTIAAGILGLIWAGAGPLMAQEVVDLPREDRPLAADFQELYRVGSLEGDAWETFGDIAGVAFDADGNLYVFDRQASRVAVVSPEGTFLREVGGPGDGPGELRAPVAFTVLPDGRIVIADLGHRAYQIFGPDGSFQRMVSMGGGGVLRLGDLAPHPDGVSVVSGGGRSSIVSMRSGSGGDGEVGGPEGRPVDRIDLSGDRSEVTTLATGWLPPRDDEPSTLQGGGVTLRMETAGPRTFEPPLLVGVLPDGGIALSDSSGYAIEIIDGRGQPTHLLRRPFEPRPVTEDMEEAEKERRLSELEEGGGPRIRLMGGSGGGSQVLSQGAVQEMMRAQIDAMRFYPDLPVLRDLATSWNGRIWVQRRGAEPTGPGPIDVLTAEGRYVGTLQPSQTSLPDAFGPGGLAAFIELDAFDVPIVVVRRLPAVLN